MDKTQSDLVRGYKLETKFFHDHVRHTRYVEKAENRNRKVKEDWSNCGELGRGGFGVVYKQIEKATGRYRAVKAIDKRGPLRLDYSRELLMMAKLSKYPSLFVKFLGWYEDHETVYIAMEYLEEGDLTKHISPPLSQETVQNISKQILEGLKVMHQQGITHRDIKPANIFVVSMSPVWVKLGDFGASKWIQAPATTTLHTQVVTASYGAPEVLGLDSNCESSDYTNSVDIWSLGCVIYELLVGTKLFVSLHQVSCYLIQNQLFLEERLKRLPTPADDVGTSLLKSMLSIQPGDRPTAGDALKDVWLAGLTSGKEHNGGDENRIPPRWDESTPSRKRKNTSVPRHRREKRISKRGPPRGDDAGCITGDVGSGVNPKSQGSASTEISAIHTGHPKSEPMSHGMQATYPGAPGEHQGKKQGCDISQICPQYPPQEIPERPIPAIDGVADQPSIHCWVLTAGETLMLAGILIVVLIGVLMRAGILTNTLGLAATLAGNLMLARATTEISMPTSTQVSVPASTLISEEIEISDGAPIPDGTQTLVAEHRPDQGNDTRDRRGGYRKNRRKRSRIRDDRTMKWNENSGWFPE